MLAWLSGRSYIESRPRVDVDDALLARFQTLISSRTGINLEQDANGLRAILLERTARLGFARAESYLQLLEGGSATGRSEWDELLGIITNGESHFFRDLGQIALLRDEILPELIERNRADRRLRIWSAGCSTGEEPYSIAILLRELLPALQGWDMVVLGSDINPTALAKARRGIYGNWSFRSVDPELKRKYFQARGADWEIHGDVRSMVTFREGNIADTLEAGSRGFGAFDLIICRNVFIYFDRSAIAAAIGTFARSLAEGGYLLTGHGELSGHDLCGLHTRRFHSSIIYQRPIPHRHNAPRPDAPRPIESRTPSAKPPRRSSSITSVTPSPRRPADAGRGKERVRKIEAPAGPPRTLPAQPPPIAGEEASIDTLDTFIANGENERAIELGMRIIAAGKPPARTLALLAHAYANRGRYDEATRFSREAIAADALALDPHYLLGHIAEELGNLEEAKRAYRNVLYLAPASIAAYIHLADIHGREGMADRARTMRESALALLERMEPTAAVPYCDGATARELVAYLRGAI